MPPAPTAARFISSGVIFALLTALSFGALTILAKLYYEDGGNALTLLLFRFAIAAVILFALGGGSSALRPSACAGRFGGILTVSAIWSLGVICYIASVYYLAAGIAALILYTFPIVVLILSLAARELRATAALWGAFLTAFGGLALMLLPSLGQFNPIGLLLVLTAAALIAVAFFLGARVSPGVAAPILAFWATLAGLGIIALALLASGAFALPRSGSGWLWLGAATLLYVGAVLSQFSALARARAAQVGMVMNLEPVVSVALAAWVLGERLTPWQWVGGGAVLAAVLLSQRMMRERVRGVAPQAGCR